jgi:phosphatidate cytidylyltransferase
MVDGEPQQKQSDLKVRAASAVVMVTGAGLAIWLGGWLWLALVGAVAVGVLWEWRGLVAHFASSALSRAAWMLGGFVYIGLAAGLLALLRVMPGPGQAAVLPIMLAVLSLPGGALDRHFGFGSTDSLLLFSVPASNRKA